MTSGSGGGDWRGAARSPGSFLQAINALRVNHPKLVPQRRYQRGRHSPWSFSTGLDARNYVSKRIAPVSGLHDLRRVGDRTKTMLIGICGGKPSEAERSVEAAEVHDADNTQGSAPANTPSKTTSSKGTTSHP